MLALALVRRDQEGNLDQKSAKSHHSILLDTNRCLYRGSTPRIPAAVGVGLRGSSRDVCRRWNLVLAGPKEHARGR